MDRRELIDFVRARGLGVIATRGPDGSPQAALVGLAATDRSEIVFDCSRGSRKYANITRDPAIALVVGWEDEVTVQIEGRAQILSGMDLRRCQAAYFEQYPDGRDRAASPEVGGGAAPASGRKTARPSRLPSRVAGAPRGSGSVLFARACSRALAPHAGAADDGGRAFGMHARGLANKAHNDHKAEFGADSPSPPEPTKFGSRPSPRLDTND